MEEPTPLDEWIDVEKTASVKGINLVDEGAVAFSRNGIARPSKAIRIRHTLNESQFIAPSPLPEIP